MSQEKVKVSLKAVISALSNGVTRCIGDTLYDAERGSVQEMYDLNKTQVKELFKHPQLQGIRVRVPVVPAFEIIEDLTEEEGQTMNAPAYGEPTATAAAAAAVVAREGGLAEANDLAALEAGGNDTLHEEQDPIEGEPVHEVF